MEHKTNALRMLDQKKIPHEVIDCGITEAVSGPVQNARDRRKIRRTFCIYDSRGQGA